MMSRIQELKNGLTALRNKNLSICDSREIASNVFLEFYRIPQNKETPNNQDKLQILGLMNSVQDKLVDYTDTYKNMLYLPSDRDEELTCKLHSAFQYLKDDYFTAILMDQLDPSVKESLNQFIEFVDYNELNELIEKWITFSCLPFKPDFIPSKHFWWNQK